MHSGASARLRRALSSVEGKELFPKRMEAMKLSFKKGPPENWPRNGRRTMECIEAGGKR